MVPHLSILCGDILGLLWLYQQHTLRMCISVVSCMQLTVVGVIHTLHFGMHASFLFLQVMYFRQGHEQYLQEVRKEQVFPTRGMQLPWQHFDLRVRLGLVN